jgi:uncharacterized DUF497 family protein
VISQRFEWDDDKAVSNFEKHGVSFELASEVFDDPQSLTVPDLFHSDDEEREMSVGTTMFHHVLVVNHTTRGERIRIISARRATRKEKARYMDKKNSYIHDDGPDSLDHEIDFSKGVRGKFHNPKNSTTVLCRIDEEVVKHFPTNEDLNNALRAIIAEGRAPGPRPHDS